MSPIDHVRRANTILYCADWATSVVFYRDVLGGVLDLRVTFSNEWFAELVVSEAAHVALADATRATIAPADGAGLTLSWQVNDLAAVGAALRKQGVSVSEPASRWGSWYIEFHDPDRTRIELWSETDPRDSANVKSYSSLDPMSSDAADQRISVPPSSSIGDSAGPASGSVVEGGESPCYAHLLDLDAHASSRTHDGPGVVVDRLGSIGGSGGPIWKLPSGSDLEADLVRLDPGQTVIGRAESDVLMFVQAGKGQVSIGSSPSAVGSDDVVLVPGAVAHSVTAGPWGLTYLTVRVGRPTPRRHSSAAE